MTDRWHRFCAFNAQIMYGYGSAEEAERFLNRLNLIREVNQYWARPMDELEVRDLNLANNDLGFALAIALDDADAG